MPVITLPGGPLKRRIVEMAYGKCGLAGYELGRTPEEVSDALSELNAMMLEWPFCCLGYEQPTYGLGHADDLSGIPADTLAGVATQLALRLAPNMGKTLSKEGQAAVSRSMSLLYAKTASIPTQPMQNHTPRGMGDDRWVDTRFIEEALVSDSGCVPLATEGAITPAPPPASPPPPPPPPPPAPPTLQVLALSASSILENSAAGTVIGAIQNTTTGSALSLSDSAGSRFAIAGGNLVAGATPTNFESASSHSVTIVETLAGAVGSPKSTTLTVIVGNVFEQPNLGALAFSATTFLTTAASSGTIVGATSGSTITASGLPAGLTIDGAARTWAWDGTGSAATSSFTLTETLADSANSPVVSTVNYTIEATPGTLQVLTLSNSSIAENSAAGTVVGAVQNVTAGSALSLSDTAGSRFAISGGNIVAGATATNYESATTHNITIVETLAGATGNPKSTTIAISVANVFEQPTLAALALSSSTFTTGLSSSGTINGATATSTITASGLPSGLTINGAARTWAWDGTGSVGSGTFTLTETLADSSNSPRANTISYTITTVGALATPTLALSSAAGAVPVSFDVSDTDYVAGLYGQLQIATDSGFSSITQDKVFLLEGDAWARLDQNYGFVDPSGTYYARFRFLRDNESGATTVTDQLGNVFTADASPWSNTVTDTINVSVATWSTSTGADKSQYLTLSGGSLTATMNNSVNGRCGVRATISASGKRYFELTVVSLGTETNGSLGVGVTDATTALGAATFPNVGGASGGGGCSWTLKAGSTATTLHRNGAAVTGGTLSNAPAVGDKIGIGFDTTANTVKFSHRPVSTGVWYDLQTVTLTSQIPASWRAYVAGYGRTGAGAPYDAATGNFGGTAFSRTLDSGYLMYG